MTRPAIVSPPMYHPRIGADGEPGSRRAGLIILAMFAVALGVLLVAPGAALVQVAYLPAVTIIGLFLIWSDPALFVGYAIWLWLLTPLVRRLVDYQIGWNPTSAVLAGPPLVTALCGLRLLRWAPLLRRRSLAPIVLILMGLACGYVVGVAHAGLTAASYALVTWVVPPLFGFHIVALRLAGIPVARLVQRVTLWGVMLLGAYGTWQFVDPPAWDRYWMVQAKMASVGSPEPFMVRVFGPLNSPAPFAIFMMAALLLLLPSRGALRWPSMVMGYIAFFLSLVRSAWLGWMLGFGIYSFRVGMASRMRLVGSAVILVLLLLPLLSLPPVANVVLPRVTSLTDIEGDVSYQDRMQFSRSIADELLEQPLGFGLGSTGATVAAAGIASGIQNFDNGVVEVLFTLGWVGGLLYFGGYLWLCAEWFLRGASGDRSEAAFRAGAMAVLAVLPAFQTLTAFSGVMFWTAAGLGLPLGRGAR